MNEQLALLGGQPLLHRPLMPYRSMGTDEAEAVARVIASDCLSGFYGSPGPEFMGGPEVRAFEEEWCAHYGVRHTISVNSATTGLMAAVGAVGVSPGDEVIVPPYTMSATAIAPLFYGGIPVFADIEPETFCIDVAAADAAITPKTKAIIAVNLFGHPARLKALRELADRRGIWLIEDNAQAPLASENGRKTGTIGHIGVFSLNYHKHIHAGEGGMCVTDDERLAQRLAFIRNHGENCAEDVADADLVNMIGLNLRMTELSAAVGRAQLKHVEKHVLARERIAASLSKGVAGLKGLTVPMVREDCRHNYYCWTMRVDPDLLGVDRDLFSRALAAEGFANSPGYVRPLYLLPVFQKRVAIGSRGFPFSLTDRVYERGACPVTERMHEREVLFFEPCAWAIDDATAEHLVEAIHKVHRNVETLAAARIAG